MANFTIATWNVNSLRVRLSHLADWLSANQPDVIALQETKSTDSDFPIAAIQDAGYCAIYSGQKSYNGMALLSREKIEEVDVLTDIPGLVDPQRRILCGTVNGIRIINLYVPNGQTVGSEKYAYKLMWLDKVKAFVKQELAKYPKLVVVGDFNIAPHEIDVHDPALWAGKVLFSELERQAFADLLQLGLTDAYRALSPNEAMYTWWDYRLYAFKRNLGMRIDHILMSHALFQDCEKCFIDKLPRSWERPSDHAPVVAQVKI